MRFITLGLLALVLVWTGAVSGVTIYRFGGASLPPPPEVELEGVDFVQVDWTAAVDSLMDEILLGELFQVEASLDSLAPVQYESRRLTPDLGGRSNSATRALALAFDGDNLTAWILKRYLCERPTVSSCDEGYGREGVLNLDLGQLVFLEQVKIASGQPLGGGIERGIARNVRIHLPSSTESFPTQLNVAPRRPFIAEVRDNQERYRTIPIEAPRPASALQLAFGEHNDSWEINEIMIYARGYAPEASYLSHIIDFGNPVAVGNLRWSGRLDPGAQVTIQTRSGRGRDPFVYWKHTGIGNQRVAVTKAEYDDLFFSLRAGRTYNQANWTAWPLPYDLADTETSPFPAVTSRRFFQFQLNFRSGPEAGSRLDFVELSVSQPLASALVGEISPIQVDAGKRTRFTYALKPAFQEGDVGFDALAITSSSSRILAVETLRIDDAEVPFTLAAMDEHGFTVQFSRLASKQDSDALLEVEFDAQVLRYGARFHARVFDYSRPLEVPQQVLTGDASDYFDWDRDFIVTAVGIEALIAVRIAPTILTPNGDGVNDQVHISYEVLETTGPLPVLIEILDLAGRRVRQVHGGEELLGHHEHTWDGRDDAGRTVPPGVYVYRIFADADEEQEWEKVTRIGTLHVVY